MIKDLSQNIMLKTKILIMMIYQIGSSGMSKEVSTKMAHQIQMEMDFQWPMKKSSDLARSLWTKLQMEEFLNVVRQIFLTFAMQMILPIPMGMALPIRMRFPEVPIYALLIQMGTGFLIQMKYPMVQTPY